MNSLWSFISNEQFWLANNMSWHDFARLKQEEGINLPVITDLLYVYPLGSVLYLIRIFFERYKMKNILLDDIIIVLHVFPLDILLSRSDDHLVFVIYIQKNGRKTGKLHLIHQQQLIMIVAHHHL